MSNSLKTFIENWSQAYALKSSKLQIFDTEASSCWTLTQKQRFVRHFYHARGHFHDFLWHLGNHTNSKDVKDVILQNIAEELNFNARSHEQMYLKFAESFDVDLSGELFVQNHYPEYIRNFNLGHLKFLEQNCPEKCFSAFAAYERLDNLDYKNLYELATSIGTPNKALVFFKIHMEVTHFESTEGILEKIWDEDPQKVVQGFDFIGDHQLYLWQQMANDINDADSTLKNAA